MWVKHFAVLVFSITVSVLIYLLANANEKESLQKVHAQQLFESTSLFSRELGGLSDLAMLLASNASLRQIENTPNLAFTAQRSLTKNEKSQVARAFIRFAKVSPNISQIRWLDNSGQEQVRVEFKNNKHLVISAADLQNKSQRYYFQRSMQKPGARVYLSPIDLNVERGEIERPLVPNIRATIPTSGQTHLMSGLLVINYNLKGLLSDIRKLSTNKSPINIANKDGYWILHEDPAQEWGFMFGNNSHTLQMQQAEVWESLQAESSGHVLVDGLLYSYTKINLYDNVLEETASNDLLFFAYSENHLFSHTKDFVYALICFFSILLIGLIINYREYRFLAEVISLSNKLRAEKQTLKLVNQSLEEYIARQKLLQDELVETRKLASLGLMVSGVAHELNTPIGGASIALASAQNAQLMLDNGLEVGITKREYQKAIETIEYNLSLAESNMQKAVARIKKFERLAIDRMDEDCSECSLEEIISNALKTLQPLVKQKDISINTLIQKDMILYCPTGILTQVIENLVLNSINHGLHEVAEGRIDVIVEALPDAQVKISVADNGVGIPQDIKERLLEPFITNARGRGNIGLGLYMVEQWVSGVLKGRLSFVSTQNTSEEYATIFSITIPKDPRVTGH